MTRTGVVVATSCLLLLTGGVSSAQSPPECRRLDLIAEYVNVPEPSPGDIAGLDGASGIAMSPDGACVYAASSVDDAIAVFARNTTTGALTYVENHSDGDMSGVVDGLNGATAVAVTADNGSGDAYVFVAGEVDDAVARFVQQAGSCALTYLGATSHVDVNGPRDLALSSDGADLFVASGAGPGTLVTFAVGATGTLTPLQAFEDDVFLTTCLQGASSVAASADGKCVYVAAASDDAVCVFNRDAGSGVLDPTQDLRDTVTPVRDYRFNDVRGVATAADDQSVYVTAHADDALSVGTRQAPSFGDAGGCILAVTQELTDATLNGAAGVTVNPAGTRVFVVAESSDAITHYKRDPAGALSSPAATSSATILNGAYDVVTNGADLYTANGARDSVAAYEAEDCCGDGTVHQGEVCDHPICCSADCQAPSTPGTGCNLDGNACTVDSCNAAGACVLGPCSLGTACTKPCNGGAGTCKNVVSGGSTICTCN